MYPLPSGPPTWHPSLARSLRCRTANSSATRPRLPSPPVASSASRYCRFLRPSPRHVPLASAVVTLYHLTPPACWLRCSALPCRQACPARAPNLTEPVSSQHSFPSVHIHGADLSSILTERSCFASQLAGTLFLAHYPSSQAQLYCILQWEINDWRTHCLYHSSRTRPARCESACPCHHVTYALPVHRLIPCPCRRCSSRILLASGLTTNAVSHSTTPNILDFPGACSALTASAVRVTHPHPQPHLFRVSRIRVSSQV
ncbi:hypothetical protein MSAN_02401900 [Mycena sanguinolenta]|uniref:Uncharacterized protein n=1 Tax=Mycena sanguinolenta TaxID=230812 RepID=A0A8H6X4A1_9AGAR|nr:hypothetical protein MSAN_02401900 [Mycena sanguinolenta]